MASTKGRSRCRTTKAAASWALKAAANGAMPTSWLLTATIAAALAIAGVVGVPVAAALPECTNTAPQTTQCERGSHVQINTSPNVTVNTGPFLEEPWLYSGIPVFGIGDWAVP